MTDKETLIQMLTRAGIEYREGLVEVDLDWAPRTGDTAIYVADEDSNGNRQSTIGYNGFGACFRFNASGTLISIGGFE